MKNTIQYIIASIITLCFGINQYSFAQDNADERINLYTLGKPIVTHEDNFENLFSNWGPKYVTNFDDIKFISYKFVEKIKNKKSIERFLDLAATSETLRVSMS